MLEEIAAALRERGMLNGPALDELISQVKPETALPTQGERALEIRNASDQPKPEDERVDNSHLDWSAAYRPLDRAA